MQISLEGKVALVTGASKGIGKAIAAGLAGAGASVMLSSRKIEQLEAAADEIRAAGAPGQIAVRAANAGHLDAAEATVAETIERFGRLDILVNNAATREYHRLADADAASWQRILAVNVIGAGLVTALALPWLRQSGRGAVVNVASTFGICGRGGMGQYDATKAAMVAATRVLAIEEARHGVRANAVCPGSVLTGFTLGRAAARGLSEAELKDRGFVPAPIARWGEPAEIAAPVLWLASDEASFVTGAVLPVDGGVSASGMRVG